MAERKNAIICHEFLNVFMKCESRDGHGLLAYLELFGKFSNLRSMANFEKVRAVTDLTLGHYQSKTREAAVSFFTSAFKELRSHKVKHTYQLL